MSSLHASSVSHAQSIISISNLSLPNAISVPSPFGSSDDAHTTSLSELPACLSLALTLRSAFSSAAAADQLDSSTIHYGQLAKRIRSQCAADPVHTPDSTLDIAERVVREMAQGGDGAGQGFIVESAQLELCLPKGSMLGEGGVQVKRRVEFDAMGEVRQVEWGLGVQGLRVKTLIGVNARERLRKQPLVVEFEISGMGREEVKEAAWRVEERVVQILEDRQYETLETLSEHTFQQLRYHLADRELPGVRVRIKLEKPLAIAQADAPAIEIVRDVPSQTHDSVLRSHSTTEEAMEDILPALQGLAIFKPYVG